MRRKEKLSHRRLLSFLPKMGENLILNENEVHNPMDEISLKKIKLDQSDLKLDRS